MTTTEATELLRRNTARLAEQLRRAPVPSPSPEGAWGIGTVAQSQALGACVGPNAGVTEELLSALSAHHSALASLERVVGSVRASSPRPGDAVALALDGAYEASDAAHEALRCALASLRDAARLQGDALRVAHLAVMIAATPPRR